ncbi:MAG: FAD-dependent oxidoreductase [Pseudonocardiaceae bacterium]|nr:FAD-dependent oxidoreductase [Pseudonocardiaceae bacterium]
MPETCDVVVIGGGMAGVSVGYQLAGERRVVLLEAERMPATHATGRSAATYLASYGSRPVRALTAASRTRFDELADRFELPAPLRPRPVLWVASDEHSALAARGLLDEQPDTLHELDAVRAREYCPVLNPGAVRFAALDEGSEDIDVLAVHQAYLRGFRERGGQLRTSAPVRGIGRRGSGWRVHAGDHVLDCELVVNAAGAWADRIAGLAGVPGVGLVPKWRTLFTSPVGGDAPWHPTAPLIADAAERCYLKPEGTGVLASPADAEPCEPGDARADELGIARALEEINRLTVLGLRTVHRSWAGLRTFSPDGAPVVGWWPEYPGFAFFAGQGGYGIQMAPALAAFGAAVFTGASPPADIELSWTDLAPDRVPSD